MNFIPIKTPKIVKWLYPNLTWAQPLLNHKTIYLTFDDGPTPNITNWVLEQLKLYNAKATFFCIGKNIETHPQVFKAIITDGHSVGNHTYNHLNGRKSTTLNYLKSVKQTQTLITSFNIKSNLFRPPYGQIRYKQIKALLTRHYKIIMWSVLSFDWDQHTTANTCLSNIIKNTKNGDIIVFHDSVKASENLKKVLPQVLAHFSKKGFQFKQITAY